jgi:hypothetical protein
LALRGQKQWQYRLVLAAGVFKQQARKVQERNGIFIERLVFHHAQSGHRGEDRKAGQCFKNETIAERGYYVGHVTCWDGFFHGDR